MQSFYKKNKTAHSSGRNPFCEDAGKEVQKTGKIQSTAA